MQTIVLTGSTGGLGVSLVKELNRNIENVLVCIYRNEEKYRKIFNKAYPVIHEYKTYPDDEFASLTEKLDELVDDEVVLILNAFSIIPIKLIGEYTASDIDKMIDGNIKQNVVLINQIVKMCKHRSLKLRIINIDSGAADYPLTGWGNYCASKAYLNSFLAVVSHENHNYKVISVDPGVMDTNMQEQIRETDKKIFPETDMFIAYKMDKKLRKTSDVAKYIVDRYIFGWHAEKMREKI